jgi:pimeloyl-ACP methyl ester carboxylesterase
MLAAAPLMSNSTGLKFDIRTYGVPENPCAISIVGTGASMNGMNTIVRGLAQHGLFVINYNPRDVCGTDAFKQCDALVPTDKNLTDELGSVFTADGDVTLDGDIYAPYNWYDLADDVAAVMDANNVSKASIIGFSTGGGIAQVAMCRMPERLSCAIICSSAYDTVPSEKPFQNASLEALIAASATLTPESTKAERVERLLPVQKAMFEICDGDPREATLREAIEDDHDNGWVDKFGGMNPFSILAWASFAKTHEEHTARLKENTVPCLIIAGKSDPFVPFCQSEKLAANTGSSTFEPHEHGHILGPAVSSDAMLTTIASFIKEHS